MEDEPQAPGSFCKQDQPTRRQKPSSRRIITKSAFHEGGITQPKIPWRESGFCLPAREGRGQLLPTQLQHGLSESSNDYLLETSAHYTHVAQASAVRHLSRSHRGGSKTFSCNERIYGHEMGAHQPAALCPLPEEKIGNYLVTTAQQISWDGVENVTVSPLDSVTDGVAEANQQQQSKGFDQCPQDKLYCEIAGQLFQPTTIWKSTKLSEGRQPTNYQTTSLCTPQPFDYSVGVLDRPYVREVKHKNGPQRHDAHSRIIGDCFEDSLSKYSTHNDETSGNNQPPWCHWTSRVHQTNDEVIGHISETTSQPIQESVLGYSQAAEYFPMHSSSHSLSLLSSVKPGYASPCNLPCTSSHYPASAAHGHQQASNITHHKKLRMDEPDIIDSNKNLPVPLFELPSLPDSFPLLSDCLRAQQGDMADTAKSAHGYYLPGIQREVSSHHECSSEFRQ